MSENIFKPLQYHPPSAEELNLNAMEFRRKMDTRRSVRHFSDRKVDKSVIEDIIMTASSAPSGAHKQPWMFCAISDTCIKSKIREAAEKEEYENYHGRMSDAWLKDLEKFDTDWHKEFLTQAPWLIVIFKKAYELVSQNSENTAIDQERHKNYYVNESTGIAAGMLITAIHMAGLVTLTHTPSPMNFLQKILQRPENERPFLLLPVGYPATAAHVPLLKRKSEEDVIVWY